VDYQSGPEQRRSKGCRHFVKLSVFDYILRAL